MSNLAISKETFCRALNLIKEQQTIDDTVGDALELVSGGWVLFNSENKNLEALLMVLQEVCNDKYDYIGRWLYETVEKVVYERSEAGAEQTVRNVEAPEALYDFIIESQPIWTATEEAINNGEQDDKENS
jgi:hypothetical protein